MKWVNRFIWASQVALVFLAAWGASVWFTNWLGVTVPWH